MARRSDHSREEIREMALAAAEKLIAEEGFSGVSARKVASAIGYTVGTLYLVFRNLDDLMLHVNGRTLDDLHEAMTRAAASCREPEACVKALGRAYIQFASDYPNRWGAIYEHRLPDEEALPEWYRQKIARSFKLVEDALGKLARGRSPHQIEQAAHALWGGVHGICLLALTNKLEATRADSVQVLAELLITNFLAGLTK